ncbi:MAG: metal-dependent transcriptional regulator [Chloroflexi bacterium]|nr:metal-dependent transcriptional regulator [Chloroflexota bacterium]
MLSESMQDYLKTIYEIGEGADRVTTNALADMLGVTAASVTGMLKKLAEMKLVEYEPYQGVVLTLAGQKIALEVIRHHRLTELYLTEAMGFSWDRVHEEAERLEHAISEEFADKMSALLGDPKTDPHGSPIPSKDGHVASSSQTALSDVPIGETVQVERISDENPALLRSVAALGLVPRAMVTITARNPENNRLSVAVGQANTDRQQQSVEHALAEHIFVRATSTSGHHPSGHHPPSKP